MAPDLGWLYRAPRRDGWPPVAAFSHPKALPTPPPPTPMPTPDLQDPEIIAIRRRQIEAALLRGGRASTNLTDDSGYSRDKLGMR